MIGIPHSFLSLSFSLFIWCPHSALEQIPKGLSIFVAFPFVYIDLMLPLLGFNSWCINFVRVSTSMFSLCIQVKQFPHLYVLLLLDIGIPCLCTFRVIINIVLISLVLNSFLQKSMMSSPNWNSSLWVSIFWKPIIFHIFCASIK